MATTKRKLIIDTDAGVDDAQAMLMALSVPDVELVGITCVAGNADAGQVGLNVLRVLQVANRLQVPVYVGCDEPLLGNKKPKSDYHGSDGFGDAPDPNAPDASHLQQEHAVQALIRMSKEHSGDVSLVCIGPLTNIAMAIRMDAGFGKRLKHCYIMGGNYKGRGNITVSAEFNFYCDPEAAYVTLNQLGTSITLVPWEVCDEHTLSWATYNNLRAVHTTKSVFLESLEKNSVAFSKQNNWGGFVPADEILLACALSDDVIKTAHDVYATVEIKGEFTWGQMVVDWNNILNKKSANMKLITDINSDKYMNLLYQAVDRSHPNN